MLREVSTLGAAIETGEVVKGGENQFVHRLPGGTQHPNLVLKRGVAVWDDPLVLWLRDVIDAAQAEEIETNTLITSLSDERQELLAAWEIAEQTAIAGDAATPQEGQ